MLFTHNTEKLKFQIQKRSTNLLSVSTFIILLASLIIFYSASVHSNLNECEKLITVDSDFGDTLLTQNEKAELLDARFFDALSAYNECLRGKNASGSSLGNSSNVEGHLQGTESLPSSDGSDAGTTASGGIQGSDIDSAAGDQPPMLSGNVPEDIPAADNDDALARQLRRAAENETDPELRKKLWDEYRRYKGLPLQNNNPRNNSTSESSTQNSPNAFNTQSPTVDSSSGNKIDVSRLDSAVAVVETPFNQGSGFVIAPGKLITNQHVVDNTTTVRLYFGDGTKIAAKVSRVDKKRDVALVKFNTSFKRPSLPIREQPTERGEDVYSFGAPLGLPGTLRKGIISTHREDPSGMRFIQSDVAINPGNSGGPLLDKNYSVVGIAVQGVLVQGSQQGLNFFIPIKDGMRALGM